MRLRWFSWLSRTSKSSRTSASGSSVSSPRLPAWDQSRSSLIQRALFFFFGSKGTKEHALGRNYVYSVVQSLERECALVPGLECEVRSSFSLSKLGYRLSGGIGQVWWQVGAGAHRFHILDHDVLKTYTGLSNIILRISDGSEEAKESALLVSRSLLRRALAL